MSSTIRFPIALSICFLILLSVPVFADDEDDSGVEFSGRVETLPSSAGLIGNWTVGGRTVRVSAITKIESENGPVVVGSCIEVKGSQMNDGSINASRIEAKEASKCVSTPPNAPAELRFFGSIERLPASGFIGDWLVSGRTIRVTSSTEIEQEKAPVTLMACVRVSGNSNPDGSISARSIETKTGTGGCASSPGTERFEVEFRGVVQAMPASGMLGIWTVSGRKVEVLAATVIHPNGRALRVGDCVELKGRFQSDESVAAQRIQGLGEGVCKIDADSQDTPKFVGSVQNLPASGLVGDWLVGTRTVRVSQDTRIETEHGAVQVGSCVEVRGPLQGAIILASRIETEDASKCAGKQEGRFEFSGAIESIPAGSAAGDWKIGGRTVRATQATIFETRSGRLIVGACVEVEGLVQTDGVIVATKIEVKSENGACILPEGVVSAASISGFSVTPGQIVSIFGMNIGPATQLPLQLGADNRLQNQLGNTRVLFDGMPAPMLFASLGQLNVVVPCAVAGKTNTVVQVESNGAWSNTTTVPVVASAPSLFTLSTSGTGRGAILNYEPATGGYSVNDPSNAATRGSLVLLYGTGEGQTNPPCADGVVTDPLAPLRRPVLPVSVTIGGRPATVEYFGAAPGLVAGVFQANVRVPTDVSPGPSVAVVVTVGSRSSQPGVTMAVR